MVIAGEGMALLVGMHFLSGAENLRIPRKNDLMLGLDILVGVVMLSLALAGVESLALYALCSAAALGTLTHLYRGWESLAGSENPFCFNAPLFAVNAFKLASLLASLILAVASVIGKQA